MVCFSPLHCFLPQTARVLSTYPLPPSLQKLRSTHAPLRLPVASPGRSIYPGYADTTCTPDPGNFLAADKFIPASRGQAERFKGARRSMSTRTTLDHKLRVLGLPQAPAMKPVCCRAGAGGLALLGLYALGLASASAVAEHQVGGSSKSCEILCKAVFHATGLLAAGRVQDSKVVPCS